MAIVRLAAAWKAGSTANAAPLPATPQAGDLHIKFCAAKPYNATLVDLAGWTPITGTNGSNGTVANGTDVGSVVWKAWYRYWVAGDSATPSFAVTTGNTNLGVIVRFRPTAGSTIDTPVGAKGFDVTSGTGYSATMDAAIEIAINDILDNFTFLPGNNSTFGTPTITATGATLGTVTENPVTEGSSATGLDCEASASTCICTAGSSSSAAVVGWTLSVAQTGGGCFIRIRETAGASSSDIAANYVDAGSGILMISGG